MLNRGAKPEEMQVGKHKFFGVPLQFTDVHASHPRLVPHKPDLSIHHVSSAAVTAAAATAGWCRKSRSQVAQPGLCKGSSGPCKPTLRRRAARGPSVSPARRNAAENRLLWAESHCKPHGGPGRGTAGTPGPVRGKARAPLPQGTLKPPHTHPPSARPYLPRRSPPHAAAVPAEGKAGLKQRRREPRPAANTPEPAPSVPLPPQRPQPPGTGKERPGPGQRGSGRKRHPSSAAGRAAGDREGREKRRGGEERAAAPRPRWNGRERRGLEGRQKGGGGGLPRPPVRPRLTEISRRKKEKVTPSSVKKRLKSLLHVSLLKG